MGSGERIVEALDLTRAGAPTLERLLLAPDSGRYLRVVADGPDVGLEEFAVYVPRTRFFFNVSACRELKGDALVALAAYMTTHSAPAAATAAALRKVGDNLKRLTEEEAAMVRAIIRACQGNPYEVPVAEASVRDHFDGDPLTADDVLDALQSKGVISGRRGGRVLLVY